MIERVVKISVRLLLALSVTYFVYSCYRDEQDIHLVPVNQPKQWTYDITTIPLGERMYIVLIDGELNEDAPLIIQTHRTTTNATRNKPDTTFVDEMTTLLPKGKFALHYSRDDSGPEEFTYHPLPTTKGWVRVQIRPGQWNWQDSSRTLIKSQSYRSYPVTITKPSTPIRIVFHP